MEDEAKMYGLIEDDRPEYDPDDEATGLEMDMQMLANIGIFRPLEDRVRDFVRGTKSKNKKDKGEGLDGLG